MKTRHQSLFANPLVVASFGCILAFAAACGDDDDSGSETPGGGTKATAGSSSTAGSKATGGSAGKGNSSTAGSPTEETGGGGAGSTPVVPQGGNGGEASCTDDADMGCYNCPPKTHEEFLNHCPTTGCEPFDNSVLTSIKNGKLPDLP